MILRLAQRHEIIHNLTKPLMITVVTVSVVLNILAFLMARDGSSLLVVGYRGFLAQFAFLVPLAVILVLGKAGHRCRRSEAGLPMEPSPSGGRTCWPWWGPSCF